MKYCFAIVFLLNFLSGNTQTVSSTDTIGKQTASDNLYIKTLFSDSLASSFCITIKKEVKAHKHLTHSEHVIVLEGEGNMKMADKTFSINKGDIVFIPKGVVHSVKTTSKIPLKVISVQAPLFDGKDRIITEDK